MNQHIKSFIEKALKCRIYRGTLPHGTDFFMDLDRAFGLANFKTVFDIGANNGDLAVTYFEHFPVADIYSFEPVSTTYSELAKTTKTRPRVHAFRCGMGKERGTVPINVNPSSTKSSILHSRVEDQTETISINTVTEFCKENHIETIDLMKIDTEGYEIEVLEGSRDLLEHQKIKIIYAECEPIATSKYFVSFPALVEFLRRFGYEIFGIYDQQLGWEGDRRVRQIMYINPAFVRGDLIAPSGRHL
jgi:FkbM family methyltransferase